MKKIKDWRVTSFSGARIFHFLAAVGVLTLLVIFAPISLFYVIPAILVIGWLGYRVGVIEWRRIQTRIDERNAVILYRVDGVFYAVLIFLFFLDDIAIGALIGKAFFDAPYRVIIWGILWVVTNLVVGRNAALAIYSRRYEREHGALKPKWFYQRSVVGPEGMLNRIGVVVEDCRPEGIIKIGAVRWTAESIDGNDITAGTPVIVRDIEGLRLIVARK